MDHFTPQSVGKMIGLTRKAIHSQENLQPLSQICHTKKDADTPLRLEVLRMERRGVVLTFEQHRAIFNGKGPSR